jgi:hypothetical protein
MGRSSKFSFPFSGRKAAPKEKEIVLTRSSILSTYLPKAQRILGTDNNLNIDAPARDDDRSWERPSSNSSVSISPSESAEYDGASIADSRWDIESAVLPRHQHQLRAKPSSTLLGQYHGDEPGTDTSGSSHRVHHKNSSSTLRSFYDRQKSPLAISQQTSASSARDLALVKGYPPVVTRSPLLQVQHVDAQAAESDSNVEGSPARSKKKSTRLDLTGMFPKARRTGSGDDAVPATAPPYASYTDRLHVPSVTRPHTSQSQYASPSQYSPRKYASQYLPEQYSPDQYARQSPQASPRQNASQRQYTNPRLDTSPRQYASPLHDAPEVSPDGPGPLVPPKETWRSPKQKVPSGQPRDARKRQTNDNILISSHEKFEQLDLRSPRMSQIPESRALEYENPMRSPLRVYYELDAQDGQLRPVDALPSPSPSDKSLWKNVHSNAANGVWEASSAASISSRNTKTSRHTSASILSNSNLKLDSVLSLSSGSEDESDPEYPERETPEREAARHSAPPPSREASQRTRDSRRQSTQSAGVLSRTHGSKRASAHSRPSFTIPESFLPSSRISGPWSRPDLEDHHSMRSHSSDKREKKSSKVPSPIASRRSSRLSTPPLSPVPPIPAEFREDGGRSSRLMAVTEQEVALLEALRQKKARMREEIIEEHETTRAPPRVPHINAPRYSREAVFRGATDSRERILLYLDTPLADGHLIDTSEPSPDLSDFLSFGSDEDSTPRSSWAPNPSGQPRPDSSVSPHTRRGSRKSQKKSPVTPPSAVRLSAVGAMHAFPDGRPVDQEAGSTKPVASGGVELLDERRLASALSMSEQASPVAWAM